MFTKSINQTVVIRVVFRVQYLTALNRDQSYAKNSKTYLTPLPSIQQALTSVQLLFPRGLLSTCMYMYYKELLPRPKEMVFIENV